MASKLRTGHLFTFLRVPGFNLTATRAASILYCSPWIRPHSPCICLEILYSQIYAMALPPTPLCPLPLAFGYCHHPFLHPDLLSPFCNELKSYLSSTIIIIQMLRGIICICIWVSILLRVVLVFFASSQAFFFFLSLLYFAVSFFYCAWFWYGRKLCPQGQRPGPPGVQWRGHFFAYLGTRRTWVQRTQVRQVREKIAYLRTTSSHAPPRIQDLKMLIPNSPHIR